MPICRPLTSAEVTLAQKTYKHAIDYSAVRVHDKKYHAMQPQNSAITPNGETYANGICFSDYSMANTT